MSTVVSKCFYMLVRPIQDLNKLPTSPMTVAFLRCPWLELPYPRLLCSVPLFCKTQAGGPLGCLRSGLCFCVMAHSFLFHLPVSAHRVSSPGSAGLGLVPFW